MAGIAGERDRVLVTGASGFLGSAIANVFREAGFRVRVMVRGSSPRTNLVSEDEVVIGDLTDPATLRPALDGARYLIHAAADYRLWAANPDDLIRTNVEGTRNLMREALRSGVERVVYTSSVATIRPGHDETHPLDEASAIGIYKRSKVLAERAVEEMVERESLPAVIVNPSTPIGPRDVKPTPTGRVIVEAASGRMPGFVDTGLNLVHVDDVADGHLKALRQGRIGERYILGGENVLLSRMLADIAELAGRKPPSLRIPRLAVWPLAVGAEAVARFTGREPFVTRDALRMAAYKMFFDDAKARRELSYGSRPYRGGLADAVAWFRRSRVRPMTTATETKSGKGHRDENFPVASHLISPRHRGPILAFYRFVRAADDVADHPTLSPDEKLRMLDSLEASLTGGGAADPEAEPLRQVLAERGLSARHALDLLEAFRQDARKTRYADWSELIGYCALSAMPVGRFVLDVHGEDRRTWTASDALCAALQVINHLQDCAKDYRAIDRVYLPADTLARHGARIEDLAGPQASPALLAVIRELNEGCEGLLRESAVSALIADRRLALEVAVIQSLAESLVRKLRTRDPLSQRVHATKSEALVAAGYGIVRATIQRAGVGRGRAHTKLAR